MLQVAINQAGCTMKAIGVIAALTCLGFSARAFAQSTRPAGSIDNPKQITSADKGPEIDPVKLAASPYRGIPLFRTFRSFMSSCYATGDTWIYAEGDDQALYDAELTFPYPKFYKPTWGEVFDHVARQMGCTWSWNSDNRQFRFKRAKAKPLFQIQLADGWQSEDRGLYVWHAPKGKQFGMDIYYFGHYTKPKGQPDFEGKVREHVALQMVGNWPDPPKLEQMTATTVSGHDALVLKVDTPRPGGVWRQWSILVDGEAFLIVSAMPKVSEGELVPAIEKMVASFKATEPLTQPAK
jgi:hypothetical protein